MEKNKYAALSSLMNRLKNKAKIAVMEGI